MIPSLPQWQLRYLVPLLGLLAVAFAATTYDTVKTQRALLERELERSAITTARDLASRGEVALLLGDAEALSGELHRALAANSDADRGAFLDAKGTEIATVGKRNSPAAWPSEDDASAEPSVARVGDHVVATVPIFEGTGKLAGKTVLWVGTTRVASIVRRAAFRLLLVSAIGFLAVAWLAGALLRQIQTLATTLEQRVVERTADLAKVTAKAADTALFATLSPSPVVRFDREGRVLWANPEADGLLFSDQATPVHPGSRIRLAKVVPDLVDLDPAATIDHATRLVRLVGHKDRIFQVELHGIADRGFAHAYFTDITVQKRGESELAEARDRALDANRLKSQFLANMSHEIRTPMNGVLGMLGLLQETGLTAKQLEFVGAASTSAASLLVVIDDILDFSKIEAGRLELERVAFDLRTTVEDVAHLLSARAQAKGLELTCLIDRSTPDLVIGDSVRLRQVLLNLGGNAIKFTSQGEVRIRTTVEGDMSDSVRLRFEISDTGIGMTAAVQAGLFQPFTQADSSTTRRFGGTGLGLSICKRLIDLMGGSIGTQTAEGQGSTFWFTITLPKAVAIDSATPPPALTGLRALIVDDNPTNRDILRHYLAPQGIDLLVATGAEEARQQLAGDPDHLPAIALLDEMMPDEDGISLARSLKADPRYQSIRLFLLTSVGHRLADRPSHDLFDGFFTKPIRLKTLLAGIGGTAPDQPIRLPEADAATNARSDSDSQPAGSTRPTRVLVAEDNEINQMLVTEVLTSAGYQVEVVGDGAQALDARFREEFDLILMDCQMPVMDGFLAARAIREGETARQIDPIPIIALTANAIEGDRDGCLAAGMDDYLSKPYSASGLVSAIERLRTRPEAPLR